MNDGTLVIDLRDTVMPKTDQMNADHLLTGPKIIKVRDVKKVVGKDQPTWIYFDGDEDKPYKPCLMMRRAIGLVWGFDGSVYIGRGIKLYRDPTAPWGGEPVGGIRVSQMSHMKERVVLNLRSGRGKMKQFIIDPLTEEEFPTKEPAARTQAELLEDLNYAAQEAALKGSVELRVWWNSLSSAGQKAIKPKMDWHKEQAAIADAIAKEEAGSKEKEESNEE